jgi:hypothetical protein
MAFRRLAGGLAGSVAAVGSLLAAESGLDPAIAAAAVLAPAERDQFFQRYFDRLTTPKPLTRFRSKAQWLAYRPVLQEKARQALGLWPWPDRPPLNPRVLGQIEHEDYLVQRVYFQVLPEVYASGYLYIPRQALAGAARKLPAVLNPHGHWPQGAVDPTVQTRCIALAKLGYVAFCPDSTHVVDLATGLCPIGLMTWNNIRALDYLQSLDFVDASRLGCTGASGGGQQTMYLAALDDRVQVMVPAVLVSYFRRILFVTEQTHCFCNHAPGIAAGADEHELAALFAPRPTRFICATGDWTKEFPKEEYPDIRRIFTLTGGEVDCVQFDKPHNYDRDSREQMYAWMNRYLKGELRLELAKEPEVATEDPKTLRALGGTPAGLASLAGATNYYRGRFMFHPPVLAKRSEWRAYRAGLEKQTRALLGERAPPVPLNPRSRGQFTAEGVTGEKWLLDTEPEVSVPAWLFAPEKSPGRRPAVLVADGDGKQALLGPRLALLKSLLGRGFVVLVVDPRLRGELRRNWYWNSVIWGRPEEGMAARDLNCAGKFLRSRAEVDARRVFLVGLGQAGRSALFAGALDSHWAGIAVNTLGPLYAEPGVTNVVPHVLRYGDLPQFAALVAPRPLWLNGAAARFEFTKQAYQASGGASNLRCSDLPLPEFDAAVASWLGSASQSR